MRDDVEPIKDMLKARIVELCHRCLPRGRREGQEWVAHNPFVDEARKAPALKVALTGNKGAWRDWRNGDKGDVMKLIEFTQGLTFKEALTWARDFLGLEQMTAKQRQNAAIEANQLHASGRLISDFLMILGILLIRPPRKIPAIPEHVRPDFHPMKLGGQ